MSSACSTSEMFCFNVVLNVLYCVWHCGYLPNTLKCQVRVLLQRCFVSMSCSMSCIGCRIVVIIVFNLPNTLKYQVRVLVQRCFVSMSCSMSCIGCRIVVIIVCNLPNTLKCQVRVLSEMFCFNACSTSEMFFNLPNVCSMSCVFALWFRDCFFNLLKHS